jgi:hypothetical protein
MIIFDWNMKCCGSGSAWFITMLSESKSKADPDPQQSQNSRAIVWWLKKELQHVGPWTLTMEAWRLKMEP